MKTTSRILGCVLCAVFLTACGKSAPREEPTRPEEAAPELASPDRREGASHELRAGPVEAAPRAPTYRGELTFSGEKKPWGDKAEVAFTIEEGAVQGRAEVAGAALRIRGFVEGDAIRAWFGSDNASTQTPRGGYLYGKVAENSASGAFAMHGVRGESAGSGDWSAQKTVAP